MLLIFFGQIGTGKTSLAEKAAEKLNCKFINFDNLVWSVLKKDRVYGDNDEFLISFDETLKVYDHMHSIAKDLLQQEKDVVLESMYFKKQREEAVQMAKELGIPYTLIEVTCDEDLIKKRLDKRKREYPQTPGLKLYLQYRDIFEKEDSEHITVDTSNRSTEELAEEIVSKIKGFS